MTGPATDAGHHWPPLDTDRNQVILIIGRKGSGKSEAARMFYGWWPDADRLVVDVNADADPGLSARRLTDPLPARMPERTHADQPLNLHYVANPRSPTYRDDLDRAVGLALFPRDRRSLLWVDEIGEVTQVNKTPPNLRLLLMQSRHYNASAILCGPRPRNIDRLCVSQADRILIFDTRIRDDREYIADNAGIDRKQLEQAYEVIRGAGEYWFIQWVATNPDDLFICPPLPAEWRDIDAADLDVEPA